MGNACLSALEGSVTPVAGENKRMAAARYYGVDLEVLNILGDLAAMLGTLKTARKFNEHSLDRDPTPSERAWIEAVITRLIYRAGERAADRTGCLPQITRADFSPITWTPTRGK